LPTLAMLVMQMEEQPDMRRFLLGHAQVNRAANSPRRCLFGPMDQEANRRFINEEMEDIYKAQEKKWNFDFRLERPLPGRFLWQPVGSPPPEQSRTEAGSQFGPEPETGAEGDSTPTLCHPASPPSPADRPAAAAAAPVSTRQQQLTDMLRTRKRTAAGAAKDLDPSPRDLDPSPKDLDPSSPSDLDPSPSDLDPSPSDLDPSPAPPAKRQASHSEED